MQVRDCTEAVVTVVIHAVVGALLGAAAASARRLPAPAAIVGMPVAAVAITLALMHLESSPAEVLALLVGGVVVGGLVRGQLDRLRTTSANAPSA